MAETKLLYIPSNKVLSLICLLKTISINAHLSLVLLSFLSTPPPLPVVASKRAAVAADGNALSLVPLSFRSTPLPPSAASRMWRPTRWTSIAPAFLSPLWRPSWLKPPHRLPPLPTLRRSHSSPQPTGLRFPSEPLLRLPPISSTRPQPEVQFRLLCRSELRPRSEAQRQPQGNGGCKGECVGVGPIIYGHLIPTLAPGYRINLSQGLLDFKAAALLQLDMFAAENWADGTAIRWAI